jgi:RimJ/RimL family protein N-acetyltransferase
VRIENSEPDRWVAWDGSSPAGALGVWHSPDGRCRLYFDQCRPDAYRPLTAAIAGPCYAQVPLPDEAAQAALRDLGFTGIRVEHDYRVPVRRVDAPVPDGLSLITIDQAVPERVMRLDTAIRQDIPGSDGWQPDMEFFRQQTYTEPRDPRTYLIAVDGPEYVGLVRVWPPVRAGAVRRLGCVGVLAPYRGRGLARALVAAAFGPLADDGTTEVTCEIDDANTASRALFASFGAVAEGGTIELYRAG